MFRHWEKLMVREVIEKLPNQRSPDVIFFREKDQVAAQHIRDYLIKYGFLTQISTKSKT